METKSARQQFSLIALIIGLLALSIAVFNWGLQYKMSLYQNSSGVTHSPAKLWVGKTAKSASTTAVALQHQHEQRASVAITQGAFRILSPFLCPTPENWQRHLVVPWKLQTRAALRAFPFRAPPVAV